MTTAVASGDLTQKITVDARGEILELKNTINTMVDQLSSFADEVTRVAREVGTEGKLGGQAEVPGVAGTWRGLTDNVNFMATQPDQPGAQHRPGHDRRRPGRPDPEDHRRGQGRGRRPGRDDQHDDRHAARVRRAGHERGPRGRHRGQARRPGRGPRGRRDLEGPDRQRQLHGLEPHRPGAQHRPGHDRGRQRRPDPEDHRRGEGRDPRARRRRSTRWSTSCSSSPSRSPASPARSAPRASSAGRPRSTASPGRGRT